MRSFILPIVALAFLKAAAVAQSNTYALFTQVTSTKSTAWLDPTDPLRVPTITNSTAVATNYVLRNITDGTETILETFVTPAPENQRKYRVNLTTNGPGALWNTVQFTAPAATILRQRYPNTTSLLRFELLRQQDNLASNANPKFSRQNSMSGLEVTSRLKLSLLPLQFPLTMTGSGAAWERQVTGIAPFPTEVPGVKIILSSSTIAAKLDLTRSDEASFGNTITIAATNETLTKGTNGYAAYRTAQYLENLGFINVALVP